MGPALQGFLGLFKRQPKRHTIGEIIPQEFSLKRSVPTPDEKQQEQLPYRQSGCGDSFHGARV